MSARLIRKNLNTALTSSFKGILLASLLILLMPFLFLRGSGYVEASKTEKQLEAQIEELERKIESTRKQADSLAREIRIIEQNVELKTMQIKQARYQIEEKEKELEALQEDIELLEVRLDRLDETIEYHQSLLAKRVKRQYIDRQYSVFEMLISSQGLGDFMARLKYLQRAESEDRELLKRMNSTKDNYERQQELLREKKAQVEQIKREIETQKTRAEQLKQSLEQQRLKKKHLLSVTKNNEKKYQELLKQAKKELEQIRRAANVVIREGRGEKVKKGEVIGTMGSSGYSTGAHLHFGVYKYSIEDFESHSEWDWYYSNYIDPLEMLEPKTVRWDTGCYRDPKGDKESGKGNWKWPMKTPVRLTQNYGGSTCYNWMYGNKPHPALDMVGVSSYSVRAVDDGEAYFCRNCLGDGGNGVFIFHNAGKMSLYWHLR